MRAKLPWILLAISLAANAFFVAGVAYTFYTEERLSHGPAQRIDFVAERLDLSPEQRDSLLALRERAQERRAALRGRREEQRGALLGELGKPEFDRDRVIALLDERSAERHEHLADVAHELHAYLATLSPGQREAFLAMARERGFFRRIFGRPRPPGADR